MVSPKCIGEINRLRKAFRSDLPLYAMPPERTKTKHKLTATSQHMAVRTAILQHMINVGHFILGHHVLNYSSIQDYIADTNMDRESAWGTDIEMLTLAHLLQTPILSYI